MADESSFFVDEEVIERLLAGGKQGKDVKSPVSAGLTNPAAKPASPQQIDSPPQPESQKRPVEAQLANVLVLEREGKTEEALAEAGRLAAASPAGKKDPDPHWVKGHLHFEQKQFTEAAAAYQNAVDVDPNHRTAHYNFG